MAYYRRLRSGLWQATVRTPTGHRRTRTDPLKSVVKVWAEDAEAAMRRGEWADPKDGRITLAEWWSEWSDSRAVEVATRKRDESIWRTHIAPRWGRSRLSTITAWDVQGWVSQMSRDGVPPSALARSVQLLGTLLSQAAQHRMIPTDPTTTVRVPPVPKHVDRFLTRDEFWRLHESMPEERDRAILTLMTFAGLRWGEVAGLHAHRVDLERRQLQVVEVLRRDGTVKPMPKSSAGQRYVPMTDEVCAAVMPFMGEGLLFPGLDYTNWRRRVWVPAVQRAGLHAPLPTPHDARHSFGSWLAQAGVPAVEIQALMGHSSLRATSRYMHASGDRFARMVTALSVPRAIEA